MSQPNAKVLTGKHGLLRYPWEKDSTIEHPEDWGLAIASDIEQKDIPKELLQIFTRFYKLGWIHRHGEKCIFMSGLLRRILRLHGFEAFTREVVVYYENPDRNWSVVVGGHHDFVPNTGEIDVHMAVVCKGYILDFAHLSSIHGQFGNMSPLAFIAKDTNNYDDYQDFGFYGKASWVPSRPQHPMVKHIRWDHREHLLDQTREYFEIYQY